MAKKYDAYTTALDIARIMFPNAAANLEPNKELANNVADFIETLASRLADIKPNTTE